MRPFLYAHGETNDRRRIPKDTRRGPLIRADLWRGRAQAQFSSCCRGGDEAGQGRRPTSSTAGSIAAWKRSRFTNDRRSASDRQCGASALPARGRMAIYSAAGTRRRCGGSSHRPGGVRRPLTARPLRGRLVADGADGEGVARSKEANAPACSSRGEPDTAWRVSPDDGKATAAPGCVRGAMRRATHGPGAPSRSTPDPRSRNLAVGSCCWPARHLRVRSQPALPGSRGWLRAADCGGLRAAAEQRLSEGVYGEARQMARPAPRRARRRRAKRSIVGVRGWDAAARARDPPADQRNHARDCRVILSQTDRQENRYLWRFWRRARDA